MRTLKHAVLSLTRKPTKAIMIFLIMFIVFALVFTGIIIQNSIDESKKFIRIKMGGIVEYVVDYNRYYNDMMEGGEIDYESLRLSTTVAENIAKDSVVKDYYAVSGGGMESNSLKSGDQRQIDNYEQNDHGDWKPSYYFQFSYVLNEMPLEFNNEKYTLSDGRFFTAEEIENPSRVIILSDEVRRTNNLNVGDRVGFMDWDSYHHSIPEDAWMDPDFVWGNPDETFYEVIGFFSGASEFEVDRGFIPFSVRLEYLDPEFFGDYISNIYFLLDDPLNIESFIERNIPNMPSVYTTLMAGESQYETLTRPLDLMELIAKILIWVIFVAGALIIVSIVTIFVRDRRFEVGLLLSAGESKPKVVFQFIFEILIVALLAFGVATGASQATSGLVANWIIENQLIEEESGPNNQIGIWGGGYQYGGNMQNQVSMEEVAEDFNVGLSFNVLMNLLLISLGILIAASFIPLAIIVAYKPRKALQD